MSFSFCYLWQLVGEFFDPEKRGPCRVESLCGVPNYEHTVVLFDLTICELSGNFKGEAV